ncbi:hypothetical protein NDN08_002651 [Rhodosorus marinus]|uniref:Chalcone isomerase domain-containing protein n=1 Tax=Rhodosorus marinus TaxID=101924 RepID=A0AAV8UUA9_9RHOD|nr:hypothetical protein NDN08_002651 [Rhodosorus marinus]
MLWRVKQVGRVFPLVVCSSYAAYQWSRPRTGYGLDGAVGRSWFGPKVALCDAVEIYPGIKYEEGDDGGSKLVGAGLRRLLMVPMYAIGLYMSENTMKQRFSDWKGKSADDVYDDADFWNAVCQPEVDKTLVMVVAREAPGKHIQQAFDRAMIKRLRQLEKEGIRGGKQALKTLNLAIRTHTFSIGEELRFEFTGAEIRVDLAGRSTLVLKCEALSIALAEMFLGKRASSVEAKHEFSRGFARILG